MRAIRWVFTNLRLGIGFAALAVVIGLAAQAVWGKVYGQYDWRVIAVAIMLLGIMVVAGLEELLRPPNPYKHLDPRFSFQDSFATGEIHSSSASTLWNIIPLVIAGAILVASMAV